MRKSLLSRVLCMAFALCVAASLLAVPAAATSADNDSKNSFIVVTFRTGMEGASFTQNYLDSLSKYASTDVDVNADKSRVAVRVWSNGGLGLPAAPTAGQVTNTGSYEAIDTVYVNDAANYDTTTFISQDVTVQYGVRGDTQADYAIRFVDENGAEIAPTLNGRGTVGSTVSYAAIAVAGYQLTSATSGSVTLVENADNQITFTYAVVPNYATITNYIPGTTVTNYVTRLAAGGTGTGTGTADDGEVEVINPDEVPEGGASSQTQPDSTPAGNADSGETISPDSVPQGAAQAQSQGVSPIMIGGIAAVVVVAGVAIYLISRRKKDGAGEE